MTPDDATHAISDRLDTLEARNERLGGIPLSLQDPRLIAGQIERLASNVRISVLTHGDAMSLAETLGAQVIALMLSIAHAEELRIDTGDAA